MLADYNIANNLLAGRVANRNNKGGSSGTRFVQRSITVKQAKKESRQKIFNLFSFHAFPQQLALLTFPSTNWIFEGSLLHDRNGSGGWKYMRQVIGRHTMIVGIEREEAIYRTGLRFMPGVKHGFRFKDCPPYATSAIRTFPIKRYLRCTFEDLAESSVAVDCKEFKFNGAWLDFNGCITMRRRQAIESFLINHVASSCRLAITATDSRYDNESIFFWGNNRLESISQWLHSLGGNIIEAIRYQSSVPMLQICADMA